MKKEIENSISKRTEILVAEDSLTQATQIKHLLESHYYKVSVAQNGKQALDQLSKHKPSLVISDIMMPEMNGYELCKIIKSNKNTEDIPVILLTILTDTEEIMEGLSCGADGFITKPYNKEYLLSCIERELTEKASQEPKGDTLGIEINYGGKKRQIQICPQKVVKLLLHTYQGVISKNNELVQTQEELKLLNERLESLVEDRTSDLTEEIKLSNQITNRLKESEEKWRTLVTTIPEYIGLVDCEGKFLFLNHYAEGFSEKDTIGKSHLDFIPNEWKEFYRQKFEECIGTQKNQIFEYTAFGDNNTLRTYETCLVPIIQQGKVSNVMAIARDITERKRMLDTLGKSEERFRIAAESVSDCVWEWDILTGGLEWFGDIEKILGYGKGEFPRTFNVWEKVIHPDDHERVMAALDQHLLTRKPYSEEYRVIKRDSSIAFWIVKGTARWDKNDKAYVMIGAVTDITELKQGEDKLRSSEERLKILFEYAPDAYYLNDLKGNFLDGNIVAEKLMGYSRNELIGKSFLKLNLLSPKQLPRAAKLLVKNLLGRPTGPDEFVLNRKDGSKVTVEIVTHPVKIKDKTLVLGSARDISDRKRAEEALRESEEKYRRIFENVQDVFYELSIRGKILEASPSIELLSKGQFKRDDLIGKSMYDFYPDPTERRTLLNVLRERRFVSDFEINLKNRDGSNIPCSISAKIILNAEGSPGKIIGSMHDITDRKNATEALKLAKEKAEASDKLKTSFLNNISHEVRTPLNGILGFAEIMSQTDLSEEEKRVSLSMLFESSDRLLDTITNYMDISLITSGNMGVNRKDFIPEQIMKELFGKYKTKCSARKLELLLNIPEHSDKLSVNSDPEILNKILYHLLNNAIKFTEQGSIAYGFTIQEKKLEFFIKDTGIGIGKESLNSIFEHFVKEDHGPLKDTQGSGIGLSISSGLVELLGGKIWVESEVGKGSCFSFTIPHLKETELYHSVIRTDPRNINKTFKSILVAEDDEINFFYLKALLMKNTSANIIHASNGREAIDKFKENPDIGLVLMDIKMPVMDGLEATRQIKAVNRNVPVIALTAYAMAGDKARITDAGCDYYLTKPINKKLLLEKIAEFIEI